jgi:hypothetical protein
MTIVKVFSRITNGPTYLSEMFGVLVISFQVEAVSDFFYLISILLLVRLKSLTEEKDLFWDESDENFLLLIPDLA